MGIQVEFNPDLALRNWSEHKKGKRHKEECIPEKLEVGATYPFMKMGQRHFKLDGEIPLVETKGNEEITRPLASIVMQEVTHFLNNGSPATRGTYKVIEIYNPKDKDVHFEGFKKIK